MIWLDPAGHVVAGVYPGTTEEISSPQVYDNGAWHLVAVTLSATGPSPGFRLYVDGALVASSTSVTSAQPYSGYWHVGWSNATQSWPDAPSDAYFTGTLAGVGILPSALSAANVAALFASSSFVNYSSAVGAFAPSAYWSLQDSGTTPYVGAVPGLVTGSASYADISGHANAALVNGSITASSGPPTLGSTSVNFSGSSGTYLATTTGFNNPQSTSISIWFSTSTSGALVGFTSAPTDTASVVAWDRMLWVDPSGYLVGAIYNGTTEEVVSTSRVTDAKWHLATLSFGSSGEALYVDGVREAFNANATVAQNYTGYWHLGFARTQSWPDAPTNDYFTGSLAQIAIIPSVITGAQIQSIFDATSASNEQSIISSLGPTSYWPLDNAITSSLCGLVQLSIQTTTGARSTCVAPANLGTCPLPTSGLSLASGLAISLPALASNIPVVITTTMAVGAGLANNASGVRLVVPVALTGALNSFVATLNYTDILQL